MRLPLAVLCLLLAVGCTSGGDAPVARPSTSASPTGATSTFFRTPSGNVTCHVTTSRAECTPREHDWGVYDSSDFGDCDHAPAVMVRVATSVEVRLSCEGVVSAGADVLEYGSRVELGQVRCVSEREALSCARTDTGAGFTMSRAFVDTNPSEAARSDAPRPPTTVTLPADTETTGFVTPTGSTICDIYGAKVVTCFVWGHTWKATPYDERAEGPCDADYADEVGLDDRGPGVTRTTCRSDSLGGGPVLGYGHTLRIGHVVCRSARDGVTCENTKSRHGFQASKSRFRSF